MVILVGLVVVVVAVLIVGVAIAWGLSGRTGPPASPASPALPALPPWPVVAAALVPISGEGLRVRNARKGWAQPSVVEALRAAGRAAAALGAEIYVLDASLPGGGPFPPHLSHQRGRDVDTRYPPESVFLAALRAGKPSKIYVSRDRVGPLRAAGLPASYWPGHVDHAHWRW